MRSIYVLCDYGVSLTIINNLYKQNISYLDVEFFGDMYLRDAKISKKNIEQIIDAMAAAKKDKYQNTIHELKLYGLSNNYYYKAIQKNISIDSLELSNEVFCNKYDEKPKFYNALKDAYERLKNNNYNIKYDDYSKYLLLIIKNNCEKIGRTKKEIYELISKTTYPTEYFEIDLKKLQEKEVITINNDEIKYVVPTLKDVIKKIDERTQEILKLRLSGLTLNDVGNNFGLSRERIRQIIEKTYSKFPYINEDRFKTFFEEYDFSEEEFTQIFLEPKTTYYYLADRYDKGSKDFYEIEDDYLLPQDMVIRIKKLKNEIYIDGRFIVGTKEGILKYVLKNIRTDIRVDLLYEKVNEIIINNFKNYNINVFDSVHNLEALIERKAWSISGSKKTVRYYEPKIIDDEDIINIKEMLLANQGLYSTLYFFENNIDLMTQIDIRNEQELHNFLRNYVHDSNIEILRMPNVLINCTSKDEFFNTLIHKYSPISLSDFCKILRDDYGHREDTMVAYLNQEYGKYITNGIISISIKELSYDEMEKITNSIDKIIYSVVEVEEILNNLGIEDVKDFLNNLNLNRLGYKIVGPFVVKKCFDKMEDALYKSVERGELDKRYIKTNSTSYACMWKLIKNKKVIELNNQYITFDTLYKFGITREDIDEFENNVSEKFNKEEEYFTSYNIRQQTCSNLLKRFAISDEIINGLIYSMDKYKRITWKDNIIYVKSSKTGSRVRFIESIIKNNTYNLKDIKKLLFDKYNINIDEKEIKSILYIISYINNDNKTSITII